MGTPDANYQVVYRGEFLPRYEPGGLVFFQRPRECGGGYWLGRTFDDYFQYEIDHPVSLSDGILYLIESGRGGKRFGEFDEDFTLKPPPDGDA
ncbi:hypothetical protein BL808_001296 [Escherichia coli]|nr:hypothetical protein [Escherichia coli]EHD2019970.1 hypothetical protein [Escherichia coli]